MWLPPGEMTGQIHEFDAPVEADIVTIIATFKQVLGGTEFTLLCKNLPPGLRAEDNEAARD